MKWIVGHLWLIWTLWIALFGLGYFALFETIALVNKGETFSAFVVRACYAWPPLMVYGGLLVGALISHFFWVWHAPVSIGGNGG